MKLTRPINCLDIESTGLEVTQDRILSLAIVQCRGDNLTEQVGYSWMFNPERPIPPESTAVHGITDERVAELKPFKFYAQDILRVLQGGDVAGFNILGFDLQILYQELYRAGVTWDTTDMAIVDSAVIFRRLEERSLAAAKRFYCGQEHEDAHDAMGDVKATLDVLAAQLSGRGQFFDLSQAEQIILENHQRYQPLTEMSVQQLSEFCLVDKDGSRRLDFAGTILANKDGVPVFGTKRNRGVPVENDCGYAGWILRTDFPVQTHHVLERVIDRIEEERQQAIIDKNNEEAEKELFHE